MLAVNFKPDLRAVHRAIIDLQVKQVPFAMALAATRLAQGVQAAEADEIERTFDKATPFTKNSFTIVPATKSKPVAIVFPKDVQEEYLAPYIVGGNRSVGSKRGMLVPINAKTNAYRNLSRGQLASLKAKPNVFVGTVKTKSGRSISGVWQRPTVSKALRRAAGQPRPAGHLKLLIEFKDTTPARKHLDFYGRATRYVKANARREFEAALGQALATARK